ncbi:hypothetical protein [Actinocorallia lasiicapitis]
MSANRYGVVVGADNWGRYTVRVGGQTIRGVRANQLDRAGSGPCWSQGSGAQRGSNGPFWARSAEPSGGGRQAPRPMWAQPGPVGSTPSGPSSASGFSAPRVSTASLWSTPRPSRRRDIQEPEGGWSGRRNQTPPPLFG